MLKSIAFSERSLNAGPDESSISIRNEVFSDVVDGPDHGGFFSLLLDGSLELLLLFLELLLDGLLLLGGQSVELLDYGSSAFSDGFLVALFSFLFFV